MAPSRARLAVLVLALVGLAGFGAPAALAAPSPPVAFAFGFGVAGTGLGQLVNPFGAAVDPTTGEILVVDNGLGRVERFSAAGTYLRRFGGAGSGEAELQSPIAVAVDPLTGDAYVADTGNNRIVQFDAAGDFVRQFGSAGSGDGQLNYPIGIAVDGTGGVVYVADALNQRVQRFSLTGAYLGQLGSAGSGDGQFEQPSAIAVNQATRGVYVTDGYTGRVEEFSPGGAFVSSFSVGDFTSPQGIAIDPASGEISVSDFGNDIVRQFTAAGRHLRDIGGPDSDLGQLDGPVGVAIAPATGDLYVVDNHHVRIQVYAPPPVCADHAVSVTHNRSHAIVLSCTNPSMQSQAITPSSQPAHGTLTLDGPAGSTTRTAIYTPQPGYAGEDSFTYDAIGTGSSEPATITIAVAPGTAPVCDAAAQSFTAGNAAQLVLPCSADGDPLTYGIVEGPAHGTLGTVDPASGAVTYTPAAGYTGADQVTFHATSAFGTSATATYFLTVVPQQQGAAGEAGASGAAGAQGAAGSPGAPGADGEQGPPGATGATGRDAIVTCRVGKRKRGKVPVTCTVALRVSTIARVARLTLSRGGRTYVRRRVDLRPGHATLALHSSKRVPPGAYRLTLVVTDASGHRTRTVRPVRLA